MEEINYGDLVRPMQIQEYLFGKVRDLKSELILEVMARVLDRKPELRDADDFSLEQDSRTLREYLCYKGRRLGEIKLNYVPAKKVEENDSFQWQFIGSNL